MLFVDQTNISRFEIDQCEKLRGNFHGCGSTMTSRTPSIKEMINAYSWEQKKKIMLLISKFRHYEINCCNASKKKKIVIIIHVRIINCTSAYIKMINGIGCVHNLCLYFNYKRESSLVHVWSGTNKSMSTRKCKDIYFSVFYCPG